MRAGLPSESTALERIRRGILAIVVLGIMGTVTELFLIGHHEDTNQLIPLVVSAAGFVTIAWTVLAPSAASVRTLQFVMLVFVGVGVIGIVLHFKANAEFQREIDPAIAGLDLWRKVMEATAPPALSPGVMVQLGLLGLVYTYKHPALRDEPEDTSRLNGDPHRGGLA